MNNTLYFKYPASWWAAKWRDALPAGNGITGALVYGAVAHETIMLSHYALWSGVNTLPLPDVSSKLEDVRNLLGTGDAKIADRVYADEFEKLGYSPDIGYPLPLGDLKVKMPVKAGFSNYSRELDMRTGEISVQWSDGNDKYKRRLFVSREKNIVVLEISATNAQVSAEFSFEPHEEDLAINRDGESIAHTRPENISCSSKDQFLFYAATNDDGKDFGAVARIEHTGGTLNQGKTSIQVTDSDRIIVTIEVFVNEDREIAWANRSQNLDAITLSYDELRGPHEKQHKELFDRTKLDLISNDSEASLSNEELLLRAYGGESPVALIEKMWAYGKYLLISSSSPDGLPCHLYGLWCGEYRGKWAFNMANVNLEMIYWQALTGAMPELLIPVFDYFDSLLEDFKENARKLYGCRGIYIPSVTTPPSGLLKTLHPHIIYWTGGAAWIAQHYYDYYLYTRDIHFLRQRALPFMRQVALFYEDFLITENGKYITSPSNSPENNPANYWDGNGMGNVMETTMNATMDFALIKEVLTNLIQGSKETQLFAEEVPNWEDMLSRIPEYEINEDGAIKEWMHPDFIDNYHHRHMAHIYPLFPGNEIKKEESPELFKAFEVAIRKRLEIGISEQTGWSFIFMAHIFSRMSEGDEALKCLDLMTRSCLMNNFFTTHNDWRNMGVGVDMEWAPFQIDANSGWTSAVQELLVQSDTQSITLLPALPTKWKKGGITGLHTKCNIRTSINWDTEKGTLEVELKSISYTQKVDLVCPLSKTTRRSVELQKGEQLSLKLNLARKTNNEAAERCCIHM